MFLLTQLRTVLDRRPAAIYIAALAVIPFVLAAANPIWLSNTPGDLDVWMYYGYFNHLYEFSDQPIWPANAYIGTRIPYILPGYLAHHIFGDEFSRYVFNIGIIYSTIVFSYFYVLQKYLPLKAAAATAALIATNYFLLRSIGWDYVDKAVAAYEALTFAFLTCAASSRRPFLPTMAAGFTATSMIFVHLASVIVFPVFFAYSAFVVQRSTTLNDWLKHLLFLLIFCSSGAALAQLLWGALTVQLHGGNFFFLLKQINVVAPNMGGWNYPLPILLARGFWITPHLAAFTGAVFALIAIRFDLVKYSLSRFELFWLWTLAIGLGALLLCEFKGWLWLLSRDGMHSTILIPFSMIGFGILLFRDPPKSIFTFTVVLGIGSILLLLDVGSGDGLSRYLQIPLLPLGLGSGALLAFAFYGSNKRSTLAALALLEVLASFNRWHFTDSSASRMAHARIAKETANTLPIFFYDIKDKQIAPIRSVIGSFTDRALFPSRQNYPILRDDLKQGDTVVILGSQEVDANAALQNLMRYVQDAQVVDSFRSGEIWIHVLRVTAVR